MRSERPRRSTSARSTPSPVGERQMFPVHTTSTTIGLDCIPEMISDGSWNKRHLPLFAVAMSPRILAAAIALAALALPARAQTVVRNDEDLSSTRPEAWAMNYVAAS